MVANFSNYEELLVLVPVFRVESMATGSKYVTVDARLHQIFLRHTTECS